ncbi:hypothetical protein EPD60_16540 [Flaviaesturariibacter flavus]|uniref:Uncharacterized protein n=1 Tax=Flaviaesturariibacter flavus TaxID=2502780 RepID=A0A4R1B6Z2_9BACT|nr:DUF6010 family protein [Flaviaesturariibacter flavus]TCJ12158.1 hypothetical protein EPD60_16540 [Flaviaesturariibacter flavus]
MLETIFGLITAALIIVLCQLLSGYFKMKLVAATILVAIAFIYVGFSLKGNGIRFIILEVAIALGFYFMAIIGYTRNVLLLAYGILLHGVWDIFHHNGVPVQTDIPGYWPTFCFVIDIIDGLYFLFLFKTLKSGSSSRQESLVKS